MKLQTVFDNHTDKFTSKWEHYFDIYDRYLQRFIDTKITILEIGINQGGSLQVWKKYFGSKAKIVGIDIDENSMYTEEQIETYCGDQSDPMFLAEVIKNIGNPDIIIDDGSHNQQDIIASFSVLYPLLKGNGVYIIEDTHTAYWKEWGGGIQSPFNVVTIASRFTHDVNVKHIKEPYTPGVSDLKSISFYDSMIVVEKQKKVSKEPYVAGVNKQA